MLGQNSSLKNQHDLKIVNTGKKKISNLQRELVSSKGGGENKT